MGVIIYVAYERCQVPQRRKIKPSARQLINLLIMDLPVNEKNLQRILDKLSEDEV